MGSPPAGPAGLGSTGNVGSGGEIGFVGTGSGAEGSEETGSGGADPPAGSSVAGEFCGCPLGLPALRIPLAPKTMHGARTILTANGSSAKAVRATPRETKTPLAMVV